MTSQIDHLSQQAYRAIQRGDLLALKELYRDERAIKVVDSLGNTTLHTAALCGNISILKWLLKSSHLAVLEKNYKGETCAHSAVHNGSLKLLRTIVYSGNVKPLTVVCERDLHGTTILHLSTLHGNTDLVNWLTETFGRTLTGLRDNQGKIALHLAASKGHTKIVHILTRFGKQVANTKDRLGATPVFYAAQEGHLESLRFMLNSARGDLRLATDEGLTALMIASLKGHVEVVRCLTSLCKEHDIMYQCHDGATAFHMAAANGNERVLEALLCHKAAKEAIHIRDNNRNSPAHDAALHGQKASLKLLIEHGLNPNQPNMSGDTPYTLALRSKSKECGLYAKSLFKEVPETLAKSHRHNEEIIGGFSAAGMHLQRFQRRGDESLRSLQKEIRPTSYSSSDGESEVSKPSRVCGEFILSDAPNTGRQRQNVSQDKDKQLYKQPLRPRPLSLPFIEDEDIQSVLDEAERDNRNWRLLSLEDEARIHSGESGYKSDEYKMKAWRFKSPKSNLIKSRSYDDLIHSQDNPGTRKMLYKKSRHRERQKHIHFENSKRSKSADQYSSEKIMWTSPSTDQIDKMPHQEMTASTVAPYQYSFLHSKLNQPRPLKEVHEEVHTPPHSIYLSDRQGSVEENCNLKNYYLASVTTGLNSREPPESQYSENYYSSHIPTMNMHSSEVYTESVYHNPDEDPPLSFESYANRLPRTDGNSKRRPSGLPPPPLPPPRPESSQTLSMISSVRSISDDHSIASSVPSGSPPKPDRKKVKPEEDSTSASLALPVAKNKPSSLAEFITQNKLKLWKSGKKHQPKKPPRKHKKSKNFNQKRNKKNKISPKIEKMGKILEDAGALVPFSDKKGLHYIENEDQINPPSLNNSRNTSPAARSNSPTSPREAAQKFSYLPSGIMLLNPKLRHIDRPSLRQTRRDQQTRHDHAIQKSLQKEEWGSSLVKQIKSSERSGSNSEYEAFSSKYIYSQPMARAGQHEPSKKKQPRNITRSLERPEEDQRITKLMDTLEAKLEKPFHIPLPDYNNARKLEETDSPPSELELFFRKRKARLDHQQNAWCQDEVADSEQERSSFEVKQCSRLRNEAEHVVRKNKVKDEVKRLSQMVDDA